MLISIVIPENQSSKVNPTKQSIYMHSESLYSILLPWKNSQYIF